MDTPPRRLESGAEEGDRRPLAVGPGDMENGGHGQVRIAEAVEQQEDALEPEDVGGVERRAQAVELGLDRGVGGHRIVGHYAAFFALSGVR